MKILILYSSSDIGGVEKSVTRMVKASTDNDIEYILASMAESGEWHNWAQELDLSPISFLKPGQNKAIGLIKLIKTIVQEKPDLIYVCGLRLSLYLRLTKIFLPSIRIIHAVRWNPDSTSKLDKNFRRIEKYLGWLISFYITNSAIAKNTLVSICSISQDKCDYVHNGVSEPIDFSLDDYYLKKNNVIYMANIHSVKGHIAFLDSIRQVVTVNKDIHFYFIGRDDLNNMVQEEVKKRGLENNVTFTGFVKNVEPYLCEAKLSVFPSLHEGLPTAILESMALGVPVIAHDIDGVPELIDHGEDGVLIPLGDYTAFAEAIISVIDDSVLLQQYGQNAKNKILNHFTDKQCADRHEAIFKKIIDK